MANIHPGDGAFRLTANNRSADVQIDGSDLTFTFGVATFEWATPPGAFIDTAHPLNAVAFDSDGTFMVTINGIGHSGTFAGLPG